MGNAELISRFQSEQIEAFNFSEHHSFIFDQKSISALKSRVVDALSILSQQFEQVQQPFSGISPQTLAQSFQHIDLEQPLYSFTESLQELKRLYFDDAVYFHHPNYMAHLNCPIVYPAIVAELLLSSINSSLDTWDQSAGATLIEQSLIDWTVARIGFGKEADGVFTSGGTQSNLMALLLARDNFGKSNLVHNIQQHGLPKEASRFRVLTSKVSHFSVQKSAAMLGLGYDAVVAVAVDDQFRMDVSDLVTQLEHCYAHDLIPIAVVATAGTTDFGSIDPLQSIHAVCKAYDIWCHVDAAYGCGLLISEINRERLEGIENADSVTVDYHKSFFQPVSCGAFFVKNKFHLNCVTHHADYLNPLSQSQDGVPNLVNKSVQTTRRFDALKLWLSLRVIGAKQLGAYFDQVIELAQQVYCLLEQAPSIEVLHQPQLSALVFRYRTRLPQLSNRVNEEIRKHLFKQGRVVIAGTKVSAESYLKFTLLNPAVSSEQMNLVIDLIQSLGEALENEFRGSNESVA